LREKRKVVKGKEEGSERGLERGEKREEGQVKKKG
jgi:hypothetical protein